MAFETLNLEFRRRIIQEAAHHDLDLVFTVVWNLDDPDDLCYVESLVAPVLDAAGTVAVLELSADLTTRLARNRGSDRLAAEPTKRDVVWSDANVRQLEEHRMNSEPAGTVADPFLTRHPHLRIETTGLSAARTARIALAWLDQLAGQPPTP